MKRFLFIVIIALLAVDTGAGAGGGIRDDVARRDVRDVRARFEHAGADMSGNQLYRRRRASHLHEHAGAGMSGNLLDRRRRPSPLYEHVVVATSLATRLVADGYLTGCPACAATPLGLTVQNVIYANQGASLLTGAVPPAVGSMTALTKLELYKNAGMAGPLPPQLGNLTNLVVLSLQVRLRAHHLLDTLHNAPRGRRTFERLDSRLILYRPQHAD
jgi:hypothetical protein